jgi:hypothetical protein
MNEQRAVKPALEPVHRSRPIGIIIAAAFSILTGLAEVVTGFTHTFFGITTSSAATFTSSSAAIGIFYVAAGLLILSMRRWAAALALVLLGADIVGRVVLIFTGLYPTTSLKNTLSIIAGTLLVALYVIGKWKSFR